MSGGVIALGVVVLGVVVPGVVVPRVVVLGVVVPGVVVLEPSTPYCTSTVKRSSLTGLFLPDEFTEV